MPLPSVQTAKQASHACIGVVKSVGNLRDSKNEKNNYKVLDIVIAPSAASLRQRDETVYLTFDPKWFDQEGFDAKSLTKGESFVLNSNVGSEDPSKPAILQALLAGEGLYDAFVAFVEEKVSPTAEEIASKLKDLCVSEKVGYVLEQSSERVVTGQKDDGSPQYKTVLKDFLQVGRLFGPDQVDGLAATAERSRKKAEKADEKPLFVVHWEEGENPFED